MLRRKHTNYNLSEPLDCFLIKCVFVPVHLKIFHSVLLTFSLVCEILGDDIKKFIDTVGDGLILLTDPRDAIGFLFQMFSLVIQRDNVRYIMPHVSGIRSSLVVNVLWIFKIRISNNIL